MRRSTVILACVVGLVAMAVGSVQASTARADRYIVVLHDWVSAPATVAREHGAEPSHVYRHALKGYAATLNDAALRRVESDSRVAYVSEDRSVSIAAQTLPTGINRVDADLSPTAAINGADTRVNVDVEGGRCGGGPPAP